MPIKKNIYILLVLVPGTIKRKTHKQTTNDTHTHTHTHTHTMNKIKTDDKASISITRVKSI